MMNILNLSWNELVVILDKIYYLKVCAFVALNSASGPV